MLGMTGIPRPAKRLTTSWAETVDDHVISIGWLPNDTACAVGDVAGGLTVFNRQRGERLMRIQAHAHGLTALAVDPQGDRVATCGQDGVVRVWDTRTAQPVEEVEAGAAWAEQVAWSHDGTLLACAAGSTLARERSEAHHTPRAAATALAAPSTSGMPAARFGQPSVNTAMA